jgi:phage gpG-like protein
MSFRFRGEFSALDRWGDQIADVPDVLDDVAANMAEETLELIREGFEKEQDPDGKRWAPLKSREGRILQDTGVMRNSFHRKMVGRDGFTVGPSVDYATYHQTGTDRGLPVRRMVPDGDLPSKWRARLIDIANEVLERAFK